MKDISMMVGEAKFNYRAGIWIEKENKVYVEFNPDIDFTTLPGGRIKELESSKEGLIREMEEEMHITFSKEELSLKTVLENFFTFENQKYHELYFLYQVKLSTEDNRFLENAKNYDSANHYYRWIEIEKLGEVKLLPDVLRKPKDKVEHIILDELKGEVSYE